MTCNQELELLSTLRAAIKNVAHLDVEQIKLQCHSNGDGVMKITIDGNVGTYYQKQMAQEAVRYAAKSYRIVFEVANLVKVVYSDHGERRFTIR